MIPQNKKTYCEVLMNDDDDDDDDDDKVGCVTK
jgi:hypothetical protein